jgi:hypothetical protein
VKQVGIYLVAVFALWLPFSIAALVSIPVVLWSVFTNTSYAKDCLRAQDKLMAALFGWGGMYTVSAECGSTRKDCRLCRAICGLLNFIQPGHCVGAAANEGKL